MKPFELDNSLFNIKNNTYQNLKKSNNMSHHTDQPEMVYANGHNIAMEVEVNGYKTGGGHWGRNTIPVIDVSVSMLPGNESNPQVLFEVALRSAYAEALKFYKKQPDPANDNVRMTIEHEGITSNNHHWHTGMFPVHNKHGQIALEEFLQLWRDAMQSGEKVDLSKGPLMIDFQFELGREPVQGNEHMNKVGMAGREQRKRMFCRGFYDQIYTMSRALRKTPPSRDNLCFPMSILFCQVRRHIINDGKVIDIIDNDQPLEKFGWSKQHKKIVVPDTCRQFDPAPWYTGFTNERALIHLNKVMTPCMFKKKIVVFNPYKSYEDYERSRKEFVLDEDNAEEWMHVAALLHGCIERKLGTKIDHTNLQAVGAAYAQALQVHIHILRFEMNMQESERFSPQSIEDPNVVDHIYLMFGDGNGGDFKHCHAVTNIRDLLDRVQSNTIDKTRFCDYCNKVLTTKQGTLSTDQCKDHISKCYRRFKLQPKNVPFDIDEFRVSVLEKHDQRLQQYFPKKGPIIDGVQTYDGCSCRSCGEVIQQHEQRDHLCFFPEKDVDPPLDESKLWVYDVEACQGNIVIGNNHIHTVNYVCLRQVYGDNPIKKNFSTMDEFCEYILSEPLLDGATIISHNGGSYDNQFLVLFLEKNLVQHETVPRAGQKHKYLEITILREKKANNIHFKDFLMFMPGSLKSIGESFNLSIKKGDFPHMFNNGHHDTYKGSMPGLEYYSLDSCKNEKVKRELEEWHAKERIKYCTCGWERPATDSQFTCVMCNLPWWDFQQQIRTYCQSDVDILAQCVEQYRAQCMGFCELPELPEAKGWRAQQLDPFNYLTLPMTALQFQMQGGSPVRVAITKERSRSGWSNKCAIWLDRLIKQHDIAIHHAGNSPKEYYCTELKRYVDGYARIDDEDHIFQFHGCYWHGHNECCALAPDSLSTEKLHPTRGVPWSTVTNHSIDADMAFRRQFGNRYHVMHECQFDREYTMTEDDKELCNIIGHRDMFFGGRTEVFSTYEQAADDEDIKYIDVTSMYPYICTHKVLPTGHPIIYFGSMCDRNRLDPSHPDPYFGYIRCKVTPNPNDYLGLLPKKSENGRLEFSLDQKIGTWYHEEIYLAIENGYIIDTIYEIHHFDENNRSDNFFKGYMGNFLCLKQESEGWKKNGASSETPDEEEKDRVVEAMFQSNGGVGRMNKELVAVNPVRRQLAKTYLNSLWGKLTQNDMEKEKSKVIGTFKQWLKLKNDTRIDQTSLMYRHFGEGCGVRVYYKELEACIQKSKYVNVNLGAAITANARTILHRKMLDVGPTNVVYCDTDSIIFKKKKSDTREFTMRGLGNWADEMSDNERITSFVGLAPKFYQLCILDINTGKVKVTTKAKGVTLNVGNTRVLPPDVVTEMAFKYEQKQPVTHQVKDVKILSNCHNVDIPYATPMTAYRQKRVQLVITKRQPIYFTDEERALIESDNSNILSLITAPKGANTALYKNRLKPL